MTSEEGRAEPLHMWPFAERYPQILREGHHKQAPACGSPTLIRHVGIWPRHPFGDGPGAAQRAPQDLYNADNVRFFREVSDFIVGLQDRGRVGKSESLAIEPAALPAAPGRAAYPFSVCNPQALAFTLWWQDDAEDGKLNRRSKDPKPEDLRVRVLVQTHRDHATVSFFIDVAKAHNLSEMDDPEEFRKAPVGKRRLKIVEAIQAIRRVSTEQIRKGYVELPRIPEQGVNSADAEALLESADYLYDGIWREFAQAFAIEETGANGSLRYGERFAEFRGLVLAVRGLDTEADRQRADQQARIRGENASRLDPKVKLHTDRPPPPDLHNLTSGTIGFGQPTRFDSKSNESNTVLKSLLPFMRRMTPWADYTDWVACGIIHGRALYVTALGSEAIIDVHNEEFADRASEIPGGFLPTSEDNDPRQPRPLRYLIVTKGEPNREQLGRYVERINAMGAMRLFALRNIASVRNASVHIEVLARDLDGTLQDWEASRTTIDEAYEAQRATVLPKAAKRQRVDKDIDNPKLLSDPEIQRVENEHIRKLNRLIRETEQKVIRIAGSLDSIGEGGSGRMLYAIRRANYFAREFERLYPQLGIVDLDGWVNYKSFVERSVTPALKLIEATGERLRFIRERIQIVTSTIQTAALIVETAATRENTATLKAIATSWWLRFGGGGIVAIALTNILNKVKEDWPSALWQALKATWVLVTGSAPPF